MWHCVSVDIKVLPKRVLFYFFKASNPPPSWYERDCPLSSLYNLPSSPESVPVQKLLWIVPVKINISPRPDWTTEKGLPHTSTKLQQSMRITQLRSQAQDSRTYQIGSFLIRSADTVTPMPLWGVVRFCLKRWTSQCHSKTKACATSSANVSSVTTPLIKGETKQNLHSDHLPYLFCNLLHLWLSCRGHLDRSMSFPPERCHKVVISHTKSQLFAFWKSLFRHQH